MLRKHKNVFYEDSYNNSIIIPFRFKTYPRVYFIKYIFCIYMYTVKYTWM